MAARRWSRGGALLALVAAAQAVLMGACSTSPIGGAAEPTPEAEPISATGNPDSYVVFGRRYRVLATSAGYRERGLASWYGDAFHGKKTSSGVPYDMHRLTAAHKSLPIPTYARVTRLDNGRSVVVKVNDRGPFVDDRIIDLSYAAATRLGMAEAGLAPVEVTALAPYQHRIPRPGDRLAPAAVPDGPVAPPSTRPLFVQAGAFADPGNARRLQARLASALAYTVYLDSAGRLHRVRVGPVTGPAEAERLRADLFDLGVDGTLVVAAARSPSN